MGRCRAAQKGRHMTYVVVVLGTLVVVALGIAGVVYGESDDSPGLQLLGAVLIVGAVAAGVRVAQRKR